MYDMRNGLGLNTATYAAYSWGQTRVETVDPLGRVDSYSYYDNTNGKLNVARSISGNWAIKNDLETAFRRRVHMNVNNLESHSLHLG